MAMGSRWLKPAGGAVALVVGVLAFVAAFSAVEFDRGEALYENHCSSCHDPLLHAGKARHVATLADLRARVAAWSIHSGLNWSEEDVNDVTDFLNRRFYRFSDQP